VMAVVVLVVVMAGVKVAPHLLAPSQLQLL
jgi:hypothetical protein